LVDDAPGVEGAGLLDAAGALGAAAGVLDDVPDDVLSLDEDEEPASVFAAASGLSAFAALSDFPPSDFGADPLSPFG